MTTIHHRPCRNDITRSLHYISPGARLAAEFCSDTCRAAYWAEARRIGLKEITRERRARELRDGFACLNGLTDGWAMLLESVDKVIAVHGKALAPGDTEELKEMSRAIGKIMRR